MKKILIGLICLSGQLSFGIDPIQEDSLNESHPTYLATSRMEKGTYVLIRDKNTLENVKVDIIKETSEGQTSRVGNGFEIINYGGSKNLVYNPGREMRTSRKEKKTLDLDFSSARKLGDGQIEKITFILDFYNDEIEISDVEISSDSSDRYHVKTPNFFDRLDPREDTYIFTIEE